jgi:hypothetical protein
MRRRLVACVAIAVTAITLLAGCVSGKPMPVPAESSSASPSATSQAAPNPVLKAGGSAAQNRAYFDFTMTAYLHSTTAADGKAMVNWLVSAGFTQSDMEVTPDKTSVGLSADTIIVSVRIASACLIGQINSTGYHSELANTLSTGRCLVGTTRTIDW